MSGCCNLSWRAYFYRGKLIEDLLIVGAKLQALQQCQNLHQAMHSLFMTQNKLKEQSRLAQRKASQATQNRQDHPVHHMSSQAEPA